MSLSLRRRPESTVAASSLGFRRSRWHSSTEGGRRRHRAGLHEMWEEGPRNGRGGFTNSCRSRCPARPQDVALIGFPAFGPMV